MTIPLVAILIPFGFFMVLFALYFSFNLYHLWHYGIPSSRLYIILTVYLCGTVFLAGAGYLVLAPMDWRQPLFDINVEDIKDGNFFSIPDVPLPEFKPEENL